MTAMGGLGLISEEALQERSMRLSHVVRDDNLSSQCVLMVRVEGAKGLRKKGLLEMRCGRFCEVSLTGSLEN
jgi:hypothetical protein